MIFDSGSFPAPPTRQLTKHVTFSVTKVAFNQKPLIRQCYGETRYRRRRTDLRYVDLWLFNSLPDPVDLSPLPLAAYPDSLNFRPTRSRTQIKCYALFYVLRIQ